MDNSKEESILRKLEVLEGLSLYDPGYICKDNDTQITDMSLENIKSLAGIKYTHCWKSTKTYLDACESLVVKHFSLQLVFYLNDVFEKVDYKPQPSIEFFNTMKHFYANVLSEEDRANLLKGKVDTVLKKLQTEKRDYEKYCLDMLNTLFIFTLEESRKILPQYIQNCDALLKKVLAEWNCISVLNMFLVGKYYQKHHNNFFQQKVDEPILNLNTDSFTSLEMSHIKKLKVVEQCILDLCNKVETQKIAILQSRLNAIEKNENHYVLVKWLESSIKYELLIKHIFYKESFPAIWCFLFALKFSLAGFSILTFIKNLKIPSSSPEGQHVPLDIMGQTFAYPSDHSVTDAIIELLQGPSISEKIKLISILLQQIESFDFKQYEQKKKNLDKKHMWKLDTKEAVIFNIFQVEKLVKQASWFSWFQFYNDDESSFRKKIKKQLEYMERICIEEKIIWPEYEDLYMFCLNSVEGALRFAGMFSLCFLIFSRLVKNNGETLLQNS